MLKCSTNNFPLFKWLEINQKVNTKGLNKKSCTINAGPWWWSSGQRAYCLANNPQMFAKDFLFLATFRHIWSHWLDDFPAWVVEVAFQFSYLGKRHQITLRKSKSFILHKKRWTNQVKGLWSIWKNVKVERKKEEWKRLTHLWCVPIR